MTSKEHDETLRRIEALIARVLFVGALIAILIAATGIFIYAAHGGLDSGGPSLQDELRRQTKNDKVVFVSLSGIAHSLKNPTSPLAITAVGLVLLLFVPVVTVALLIPAFLKEGDYRYSAIAAIVLTILVFSMVYRV